MLAPRYSTALERSGEQAPTRGRLVARRHQRERLRAQGYLDAATGLPDGTANAQKTAVDCHLDHLAVAARYGAGKKICRPDKGRDKGSRRLLIDRPWFADLLDTARSHHRNAIRHGQRLFLVVGHVDDGYAEGLLQPADFRAHFDAQLGVQIG